MKFNTLELALNFDPKDHFISVTQTDCTHHSIPHAIMKLITKTTDQQKFPKNETHSSGQNRQH